MIGIVLLILKIIMWLIIGILGLVLALLLLVLFVPIRYKVFFEKFDGMKLKAKVSYLLHLFRVYISYDDDAISYKVKILFFTVIKDEVVNEENEQEEVQSEAPEMVIKTNDDSRNLERQEELSVKDDNEEKIINKEEEKTYNEKETEVVSRSDDGYKQRSVKEKRVKKVKKTKQSKQSKKEDIEESGFDKIKRFYGFLKAYENQGLFKFVLSKIKAIVKSILPRKIEGMIKFGFEDPSTTGYILAAVTPFYPYYYKNFELQPDFENPKFEGRVKAKGRVIIGIMVYYAIRIILDKRVRRLIKEARK